MYRLWSFVALAILVVAENPVSAGVDCVSGEIDVTFQIDVSNSIGYKNFERLKTFLQDFVNHSAVDDGSVRVGTVSYSTTVNTEFKLNRYTSSADIMNHLRKLKYLAGATNTAGGLERVRDVVFKDKNGDRQDVTNFLVVITDGKSNINRAYTIPNAKKLKDDGVCIYVLGIGKDIQDSPEEVIAMASEPAADNYQVIKSYKDLVDLEKIIFEKMCPVIEDKTPIKEGSPCKEEGKSVEKRCRTFKCINKKWKRIGFNGCINRGRCIKWDKEKEDGCFNYKCFKSGNCNGDLCPKYDYRLTNAGCLVDGQCIKENEVVEDKNACVNYQCLRRDDRDEIYSTYTMISKECVGADGSCSPVGYKYKEHCVKYECQSSQFMGIMQADFVPIDIACKHGTKCIRFGERIKEVCDTFVCSYDDQSMGYELMLESQGCEFNGECLKDGEKRFEDSTCTNFICSFSKRQNRLVMKERVAGCKGDDGGCAGKGDTVTQKGCIKYQCDNKGNFQLVEAGCEEDGECKPVDSKWRRPGECAQFKCVMAQSDGGSVETDIVETVECHDFNGNCLKPGNEFVDHCKTFQCQSNGKLKRVDAKCEYNGKCYSIGDDWIDRKICKHVLCKADPGLGAIYSKRKFGCKDEEGKCYKPGEFYTKPGSCLKYKCYDDHKLRREVCEYKNRCYEVNTDWIDMDECLSFSCFKDDYTGEPDIATAVYGCFEEGICKKPGDTYVKDCQTYECMGVLDFGFRIINSKCPWKRGCKNLNQTWFDQNTCRKYGCYEDEDGLNVEEITFGCRDTEDKCVKHNNEIEKDQCIRYQCNNGELIPQYVGCEFEDGCLDLNKFKVDEEKCIKYRCVMSNSGSGFVATKIKEIRGCLDHDKCYFPGARKTEDCSTFVCTRDGTFKIIDPQCEFAGVCKALNATWENEEKCKKFKCDISKKTGRPVVKTWVWGCRSKNKCVKFGDKKRLRRCVKHVCKKTDAGPRFVPDKIGCPFGPKKRRCKPLDQSWVNKLLCVRETCTYEEGNLYPEMLQSPYGCFDNAGHCRPFGAKMTDEANRCVKYECTGYGYFSPISAGCYYDGQCKKPGALWEDKETCTKYECKQENVGPSQVIMHTIETPGCKDIEGKCIKDGESVSHDCTDYLCDTSRGGLVITGEGCMNSGQCEPLGSSWSDPESCITYQCEYDDYLKDLFIVEKQSGCQNDNGECFNKGERKQEECNKFVCNAKGNFQVTKAGCSKDGKCHNIDESWQEGCVWYTCDLIKKGPNFVETKIVETHGCIGNDGKCYEQLHVYTDGCIKYECQKGGQFKQTSFGCVGFDGGCVLPGVTVEDDCNKYQCDSYSLSLQPVYMGCNFNGQCKDLNTNWFDKDTCLGYRCVFDPETNDVDIIERVSGCEIEGQCIRPGARKTGKDCIKYKCRRGVMVATEIGCEYNEECLPVNEVRQEGCSWKKCVIAEQGPTFIDTKLITIHGCWDCYHHCHKVGDEFKHGCQTTECMPGGFTKTIENRCMTPSGYCIPYDGIYYYTIGNKNTTYKCGEVGDLVPVQKDHKCKQGLSGPEFDVGDTIETDCIKYKCVETQDGAEFTPVIKKCRDEDGVCRNINEEWYDDDKDNKYICAIEKGVPTIEVERGCGFDGDYYKHGDSWKEGCFTKRCQVKVTNSGIMRSIVLIEGKCQDKNGDCRAVGSEWQEKDSGMCVKKNCSLRDVGGTPTYSVEIASQMCLGLNGQCHDIGKEGFEADLYGTSYYGCKCGFVGGSIQLSCSGTIEP